MQSGCRSSRCEQEERCPGGWGVIISAGLQRGARGVGAESGLQVFSGVQEGLGSLYGGLEVCLWSRKGCEGMQGV